MKPIRLDRIRPPTLLAGVLLLFLALSLPTIDREGINYDEQTDMNIALAYTESSTGLLRGSDIDVINVRFPMYSVAVLFRLADTTSLRLARLVSCAVGALTLVAIYLFCHRKLDASKGLLACLIVATSPYFLSFSRMAFTEGDVFVACSVSWTLVCLALAWDKPAFDRTALAGVSVGVALSSKISAVGLLPAAFALVVLHRGLRLFDLRRRDRVIQGLIAGAFGLWLLVAGAESGILFSGLGERLPSAVRDPLMRWALAAALWAATLFWAFARRRVVPSRLALLVLLGVVAPLTFFVVPPVHTGNTRILGDIWNGFFSASRSDLGVRIEIAMLHFLAVLIKSSVLVGAGLWAGFALAAWRARARHELRLPLLIFVGYFAVLMTLPWAQPHYMMPLFPLLAIFAADSLIDLYRRHPVLAGTMAVAAAGLLIFDLYRCYPDYNLNGYQLTGDRYVAGRSAIGYRSIVQVRGDGAEQGLRWVSAQAGSGDLVVHFLEDHIVQAIAPAPAFRLLDGLTTPIDEADYVVTQFNSELRGGWGAENPQGSIYNYPYDRAQLELEFRKVFSVNRAFDIEVASVWERR